MSASAFIRHGTLHLALCAALGLTACAELLPLDSPSASAANQQRAAQAVVRPVALGDFSFNEARDDTPEREAQYLRDTVNVEFKAAGLLDAGAPRVLTAHFTDSQWRRGQGSLAARFTVADARSGTLHYERELRVSRTWAPAIGTVGTQWTAKEHAALFQQLVGQLLADPAFGDATRGLGLVPPKPERKQFADPADTRPEPSPGWDASG
jgi:hypothetical protein